MSAFHVSATHIGAIARAATSTRRGDVRVPPDCLDEFGTPDFGKVFAALANENARSVAYRYSEEPEPVQSIGREGVYPLAWQKPCGWLLKVLDCYEYQSCEHPDWEGSHVKRMIDDLRAASWRRAPGYEETPWGLDDPTHTVEVVRIA